MKIYTRGGDDGTTSLYGGGRVSKNDVRMEATGSVDELNAAIGTAQAQIAAGAWGCHELSTLLGAIQHHLFNLGAELATPNPDEKGTALIEQRHVDELEGAIDSLEQRLDPLTQFILPGGDLAAAKLHLARCICRRAERRMVTLAGVQPIRELPLKYINRLSDFLFVAARVANQASGHGDVLWDKKV